MADRKKILALIGAAALAFSLAACQNDMAADSGEAGTAGEENQTAGQANNGENDTASGDTASDDAASADTADTQQGEDASQGQTDTLVAYFSYNGNTEEIARQIADDTGADLAEIERATPYENASEEGEQELNSNARPDERDVPDAAGDIAEWVAGLGY